MSRKNKFLRFGWIGNDDLFDVKRPGFQTLTINATAVHSIELVAPGNKTWKHPGVQIFAKFELKKGQRITAALGQQGSSDDCGSGGSFLVLESDKGPIPLLIAGGAGRAHTDDEAFGRGNIKQAAIRNENVGTSGKQKFCDGDKEDIYCGGAGYFEAPRVSNLADGCVVPKSYKGGLTGGKGVDRHRDVWEGGFGGGGGFYWRRVNGETKWYFGAGGGFTGGSTKVDEKDYDKLWWGGGGGSFSADPEAEFEHYYVEFGYCKIERQLET